MTKDRTITIIAMVMSIVFSASLVYAIINYEESLTQKDIEIKGLRSTLFDKDSQIDALQKKIEADNETINLLNGQSEDLQNQLNSANIQIDTLNSQIADLDNEVKNLSSQTSSLNSQITILQNQVRDLLAITNANRSSELKTLVFHVSEKGEGYVWGRLPNVNYTYNKLLNLTNGVYDVLLLPEYKGNLNWTETMGWLAVNFSKIPIMLSIFEGGNLSHPIVQLSTVEISQVMAVCEVKGIRIGEIVSWYIEHRQTFPIDYINGILNFARSNNLPVLWSEWKVGDNVFGQVKNYTAGFEDIVTVAFQTNSGDLEPADGFELVSSLFSHWGGSIQSWYWDTRKYGNETAMPVSLLLQHTVEATVSGAEILQFEPYWYFFDNGEPKESLELLMVTLTH